LSLWSSDRLRSRHAWRDWQLNCWGCNSNRRKRRRRFRGLSKWSRSKKWPWMNCSGFWRKLRASSAKSRSCCVRSLWRSRSWKLNWSRLNSNYSSFNWKWSKTSKNCAIKTRTSKELSKISSA
jgi:hypothetical protein